MCQRWGFCKGLCLLGQPERVCMPFQAACFGWGSLKARYRRAEAGAIVPESGRLVGGVGTGAFRLPENVWAAGVRPAGNCMVTICCGFIPNSRRI